MTRYRDSGDEDIAVQVEAYRRKLAMYPASDVLVVLERWPDDHDFWPTWHELKAAMDERYAASQAMQHKRLEHAKPDEVMSDNDRRWARMTPAQRRAEIEDALSMIKSNNPLGTTLRKLGQGMLERLR